MVLSNIVYDAIVNGLIIFLERNRPNTVIHTFVIFMLFAFLLLIQLSGGRFLRLSQCVI